MSKNTKNTLVRKKAPTPSLYDSYTIPQGYPLYGIVVGLLGMFKNKLNLFIDYFM